MKRRMLAAYLPLIAVKYSPLIHRCLLAFMLVIASQHMALMAQQISFPGAEGAGRFTSGGRGTDASPTTVLEVTNLTDVNTPGSLRFACSQSANTYPNRTIVFRVSGTIHLNSRLTIPRNTTIAGQTAPGDGICVADHPVVISGDNVIVRYIRFRMGDKNQLKTSPPGCGIPVAPFTPACTPIDGSGGDDAFGNLGNKNLMIDHCSISWSSDEALTVYRGDSVTMQWNFITEPLNYSYHFETGDTDFERHGFGGIWGSRHGSFHHNLFAHCQSRNPRFGGNSTYGGDTESADFRNNVIYNWGLYTVYGGEGGQYNLVNNYYKYGPSTGSGTRYRMVNVDSSLDFPYASYYLSGNYIDGSVANTNNNWSGAFMGSGNPADTIKSKVLIPYLGPYLPATTQAATDAYESVLAGAGASLPRRDTLDRRIANDVRYRGGKFVDVQGGFPHGTPYNQTVDAWPALASVAAQADTDHDGMPDAYETANGLNPGNAADRQTIAANGYTNLENYLNGIINTSPEVYFNGLLSNFNQTSANPSAIQSITISGANLGGNVTLTPPEGYEISADGGQNWFNTSYPLVMVPAGESIPATSLSIRLNTATLGTYLGNLISITSSVAAFYLKLSGVRTGSGNATNTAVATWTLLNNENPDVTVSLTATSQVLGESISGTSYNSSFGGVSGWQRSATITSLPIGYSPTSYQEYTVKPEPGRVFTASSITMSALGGGTGTARMAVYYSLDGFATSSPAGTCTYNGATFPATTASPVVLLNTSTSPLTGQQIASIPTSITVLPTQTLAVRVYVWITGTGNRYFASQQVNIRGSTSNAETPLPLQLIDFSVAPVNGNARLLWTTSNEVNVQGFEIEKSLDARRFITIGHASAGNTGNVSSYSFIDLNTGSGDVYYRIKMIDSDGSFRYSNIVNIAFNKNMQLSVYPNPAGGDVTLHHPVAKKGAVVQVFNTEGKVVLNTQLVPGAIQTILKAGGLPGGRYQVILKDGSLSKTCSFIKL